MPISRLTYAVNIMRLFARLKKISKNLRSKVTDYIAQTKRTKAMDLKTQKQTKRIEIHQSQIANGQGQICLGNVKVWK